MNAILTLLIKFILMKKGSTLFLKGVVVIIGLVILAFCAIAIPRIIGTFDMGGYDPILLGMYIPAIPFYIGLYHTMKLLIHIDKGQAFSELSVRSLRMIKRSAAAIALLYTAGLPYIFYVAQLDDAPGVVLIAFIIIGASIVVSVFAAVLQMLLKSAIAIKKEIDLVV